MKISAKIFLCVLTLLTIPLPWMAVTQGNAQSDSGGTPTEPDQGKPAPPRPVENPSGAPSAEGKSQNQADQNKQVSVIVKNFPIKDWWDKAAICAGWVLVIIGGITFGAVWIQAVETRRAADAAKRNIDIVVSERRARIAVEAKYELDGIRESPMGSVRPEATINIIQHGPTKAFNVVGYYRVNIEPTDAAPPMEHMLRMGIPDVIDGDNVPISESLMLMTQNRPDLLNDIRQKTCFVHFFGKITYTDVFGESHTTPFRYIWIDEIVDMSVPDSDDPPDINWDWGWLKHGPKEDNEAT